MKAEGGPRELMADPEQVRSSMTRKERSPRSVRGQPSRIGAVALSALLASACGTGAMPNAKAAKNHRPSGASEEVAREPCCREPPAPEMVAPRPACRGRLDHRPSMVRIICVALSPAAAISTTITSRGTGSYRSRSAPARSCKFAVGQEDFKEIARLFEQLPDGLELENSRIQVHDGGACFFLYLSKDCRVEVSCRDCEYVKAKEAAVLRQILDKVVRLRATECGSE
jgi:hypothetical protein